jgi:hypothetical protein
MLKLRLTPRARKPLEPPELVELRPWLTRLRVRPIINKTKGAGRVALSWVLTCVLFDITDLVEDKTERTLSRLCNILEAQRNVDRLRWCYGAL